ncbi:glutamate--tRNA ligase [Paenibacillus polysaccharolyticus]|uniref:glutamate--tRNA ligase n=1 Tax=Paenibacillus polysaccharolyticus TaxID=582692 RepID=UPI00209E61DA|nr:glutamate--tRNA ligase [Paenibacillus polysaccharolyticus]MCP1133374.1 glutamate--tRNA ligase [Paenibacillus polysaccharolyticus]
MSNENMAELLFPETTQLPTDIYSQYPPRNLPSSTMVTRFAPSPTGALNIGGLYAALISERLAHQSNGVFFLRIEDTDKKREVKGSLENIIGSLLNFGIYFDEGLTSSGKDLGAFGPYKQSSRIQTYKVFIKHLVRNGLAYPCFCDKDDLQKIRISQEKLKVTTGYYGQWAKHRDISFQKTKEELLKGKPFVVRLRSPGLSDRRIKYNDLVKGLIEFPENDQDIVIMKTDGLPTYHFAHAIDDFLMGTTHVIRGDEWLSSVPIHIQLFETLGFRVPEYGHIAPIMKQVGSSKRKFSKRKDLDGTADYYKEQGYPGIAIGEYFMHLINSDFEEWRLANPHKIYTDFFINTNKMNASGALLDMRKLTDISKDVLSRLTGHEVYDYLYKWSAEYDLELYTLINKYRDYTINILDIGRKDEKPRKDISKWSDVKGLISYFYDELFENDVSKGFDLPKNINLNVAKEIVAGFSKAYNSYSDKETWFNEIKKLAEELGFAKEMKQYKVNPSFYKGHVGDLTMVIRLALTNRYNTPDLFDIMKVMGENRIFERLQKFMLQ